VDPNVAGSNPVDRPILHNNMSPFDAIILGALQGLTEFLPISSSTHLKIAKLLLGIPLDNSQIFFDLMCHLGTLIATLYFLRHDILNMIQEGKKEISLILIALLPLIPAYFLLKPLRTLASETHCLGYMLMATACILYAGQKWRRASSSSNRVADVLWIGTMQSAALIPGISRSASTISIARMLGWEPGKAVRFSFLLSIPTIMGGNCLELLHLLMSQEASCVPTSSCLLGFLASCMVGMIVIRHAVRFLEKGNLKPFAVYCLLLGAIVSIYYG
jgi:undecaprenyl-diphosphatase